MASPMTRPGITMGSEAMLSSTQRPGIRVRSTSQPITADSIITAVAVAKARKMLFHTALPMFG